MKQSLNFLVTGGAGYLGSVLVPMLLENGHRVKVLDRFFFGKDKLNKVKNNPNLSLIEGDIRSFDSSILKNVDVVLDLASLSNDPIGELNPELTMGINFHGRLRTAKLAKSAKVKKYILASTCSVYGFRDELLDEKSKKYPVTTYARAASLLEDAVLKLNSSKFSVTVLRQGTLYGVSPRMRFDVVLNTMIFSAYKNKSINVFGGDQWRPLLNVHDSARAFLYIALAKEKLVSGQIFNIGSNKENFQISKIANKISKVLGIKKVSIEKSQTDFRSYKVSFDKIKNSLSFETKNNIEKSIKEIYGLLKTGKLKASKQTKTIDWYRYLLSKNTDILKIK